MEVSLLTVNEMKRKTNKKGVNDKSHHTLEENIVDLFLTMIRVITIHTMCCTAVIHLCPHGDILYLHMFSATEHVSHGKAL